MKKTGNKKGFTMVEVLAVLGILAVVAAFAMIAVNGYLRSMTKIEYDGYAKEIFVAAQNRLTMAESQGYLGRSSYGEAETSTTVLADGTTSEEETGTYYYVVGADADSRAALTERGEVLSLMLPAGAVDETVLNGCFIVRYHKDAGLVLDVYYWRESGRFSHSTGEGDYEEFSDTSDTINGEDISDSEKEQKLKKAFRNMNGAVIGYYGGEKASELTKGEPLEAPTIMVENADRLVVKIKNPNWDGVDDPTSQLRLTITGVTSGESRYITVSKSDVTLVDGYYVFVLDDITREGQHFKDLFCTDSEGAVGSPYIGGNLTPGEDIKIQAEAFDNTQLTNVAKSPEQKTNSLYGSVKNGEAQITSIRHLENLSQSVSGVSQGTTGDITSVKQTTDLDWESFKENTKNSDGSDPRIYTLDNLAHDGFVPIDRSGEFTYDGGGHGISKLEVESDGSAGLFGTLDRANDDDTETVRSISNLKLIDFDVTGGGDSGTLVGTAVGTSISNVVACNTGSTTEPTVKTTGSGANAGGLVGSMNGGEIIKSSASVPVESTDGSAGGLAGKTAGTLINACYTGGQTENGMYNPDKPNVKGADSVGGLVGEAVSTTVISSYSTCSAGGTDDDSKVGGLTGSTTGGTVKDCYSTGLVTGSGTKGAVMGSATGGTDISDTYYYGIINETPIDGDPEKGYETMKPVGNSSGATVEGITEMDINQGTYDGYVGSDFDYADPYDATLGHEYPFNSVSQLGTKLSESERATIYDSDFVNVHIGDWPTPETKVIN